MLSIIVTVSALIIALVHLLLPTAKIDGVTLGLLALAALPWLSPFIKSVEIPGVGKIELQEVKEQVKEVREQVRDAVGGAASAVHKAELALAGASAAGGVVAPSVNGTELGTQDVLALAEEYKHIRDKQPSGPARTSAMTSVVQRMISLAPTLNAFDVESYLKDADMGKRLFAYVYLYTRPDFHQLARLVESVCRIEDKAFGHYWGIQAIERVIGARGSVKVDPAIVQKLKDFLSQLGPGTDRYYELDHLLRSLKTE